MPKKRAALRPRGAPVVAAVFAATLEELDRVGYGGLSHENVARRAGVNPTTVYRRWPTRIELVTATVEDARSVLDQPLPDRGTLRADLVALVLAVAQIAQSIAGRAFMRMFLFDRAHPDLVGIAATLGAAERQRGPHVLLERAVARGELHARVDRTALVDALRGTVLFRALVEPRAVDEAYARRFVDMLLDGALAQKPARPTRSSRSRR